MAEFMVIEEEEEIHTCVFQERENSLDTMSDAQLVREYRFVQEVPCLTSSPVSVDCLEFFCMWDFPVGCGRCLQGAQVYCLQSGIPCGLRLVSLFGQLQLHKLRKLSSQSVSLLTLGFLTF